MANGSTLQREMTRKQDELVALRAELDALQRQLRDGSASPDARERIAELESQQSRVKREAEAIRQMAASFNEPLDERPTVRQQPAPAPPPQERIPPRSTTRISTSELRDPGARTAPPEPPRSTQPTPPRFAEPQPAPTLRADMDATKVVPMQPTPRFCGQCGATLARGAQFCEQCGAPTAGSAATAPAPPPPRPQAQPQPPPQQQSPNARPVFTPPPGRVQPLRSMHPAAAQATPFRQGPALEQMVPTVLLTIVGAAALIGGLFAPLIHVGSNSSVDINLFQLAFRLNDLELVIFLGSTNAHIVFAAFWIVLLIVAVATLIAVFGRLYALLWGIGGITGALVVAAFVYYRVQLSHASILGQAIQSASWGWVLLALGAVLILGAAATTLPALNVNRRPSR